MQFLGSAKPPVGILFDSDLSRPDSVLALALLYGFDTKNEVRVVSLSASVPNLNAASYFDLVATFYAAGGFSRLLPVGLSDVGKVPATAAILDGALTKKNEKGELVYPQRIHNINDTADPVALIRNAFTAQHDDNCIVVLAGPATNLVKTLQLPGVKELVQRKVRFLAVSGGAYPEGGPEPHIAADIPAASKLFAEWPGPIVASGTEVGSALLFPSASIDTDFSHTPNHPIADAYRAGGKMSYDAPTWDMTAVLYAARPQEGYFKLSEPGRITVSDDGRTRFVPDPNGRHRHLIYDPAQKERIVKTYTEIASLKPVPRRRPFRPQNQQQQQPAPPKPNETKPNASKP